MITDNVWKRWADVMTANLRDLQSLGDERLAVAMRSIAHARDAFLQLDNPKLFSGEVLNFKMQNWPFWFEWHPGKKIVYMVREPSLQAVVEDAAAQKKLTVHAESIAFEIGDHGAAQNAVLVYMRGFNEGRARLLNEQASSKN